jgi:hypothetical protein
MSSSPVLPPQNLPFSNFVQVQITISPNGAVLPSFNKGLIMTDDAGPIPPIGANARVRGYTSLLAMLADGWTAQQLAYQAAQVHFAQTPPPQKVYVGCIVNTAITGTGISVPALGDTHQGSGYAVGDLIQIPGGTAGQLAVLKVATITSNAGVMGIPRTFTIVQAGAGYAVAAGVAVTTLTGVGAGLQVGVTAIGETPAESMSYARAANSDWYGFVYYRAASTDPDDDVEACALFAQSAQPPCVCFGQSDSPDIPANSPGNLFANLKAASYNRVFPLYITTQQDAYPNNAFAAAGAMGVAMGRNTGAASSYFTMMFRSIVGIVPEPMQQYEVDNICGSNDGSVAGLNGNVYVMYPNTPMMQKGNVSNGQFFDQILQLDMLGADLQVSCVDELVSDAALNQTDGQQTRLLNRCNGACDRSVSRGYIGPGIWTGQSILNQLNTGDILSSGYKCMSDTYNNQAQSDKVARKAMPIYIAIRQAGVVQSVLIAVSVQQ